ncbi:hypothetical protein FACS1894181_11550 [Bacteroidia bacterium]|nr:hypothetical protein FACS1894181_11550 [Bacteroidia bacterium]
MNDKMSEQENEMIETLVDVGCSHHVEEKYEEALDSFRQALTIQEKVLGASHPDVGDTYNRVGGVHESMRNLPAAMKYYRKALAAYKGAGTKQFDIARVYSDMASVYKRQKNYQQAAIYYRKALDIYEKMDNYKHIFMAVTCNAIGAVHASSGSFSGALEWYHKALAIRGEMPYSYTASTADIYYNIGFAYNRMGEYGQSLGWLHKALDLYKKELSKGKPSPGLLDRIRNTYAITDNPKPFEEWLQGNIV